MSEAMKAGERLSETEQRARAIDNQKWQAWIDAGYRFHDCSQGHSDGLLQKCIRDGAKLFFVNTWVYVWDGSRGEPENRVGLQIETQFTIGNERVFGVTLLGEHTPQEAEQFMRDIYDRMRCTPYDND